MHPSLLPEYAFMISKASFSIPLTINSFYGPAPLHHTLLSGSERTGVTVQTLHSRHFDRGRILAQTPQPGLEHGCRNVHALSTELGIQGANMLVNCIKSRLYLYGSSDSDSLQSSELGENGRVSKLATARHAAKITKKDRLIDWNTMTAAQILRMHEIIGPLWNFIGFRRVIWSTGFEKALHVPAEDLPVGQPVVLGPDQSVYVRTFDDQILKIRGLKIEGGIQLEPLKAATKASLHNPDRSGDGLLFHLPISTASPS